MNDLVKKAPADQRAHQAQDPVKIVGINYECSKLRAVNVKIYKMLEMLYGSFPASMRVTGYLYLLCEKIAFRQKCVSNAELIAHAMSSKIHENKKKVKKIWQ